MKRVSKAFWIWCQFQDDDMYFLNNLQSKVKKKFRGPEFEVHLTLLGPLMTISPDKVQEIENICKTLNPIKITPKQYSGNTNFFTSFFIEIDKTEILLNFREKFFKLTSNYQKDEYLPHISLTYGNFSLCEKEKLFNKLPSLKKKLVLNKICIVDVNEDELSWNVIKTIILAET